MSPNRSAVTGALFAWAFTILSLLAPSQARAQERRPLPDSDSYAVLAYIQAMHQGQYPHSGPFIKVFEVGGGDPAMNGSFIYLRLDYNDRTFVWKTGLNVRDVTRMSFPSGNVIVLYVHEDFMDAQSAIKSRDATYEIRFRIDDGELRNTVTVAKVPGIRGKD